MTSLCSRCNREFESIERTSFDKRTRQWIEEVDELCERCKEDDEEI
jgi:hypothetical protein